MFQSAPGCDAGGSSRAKVRQELLWRFHHGHVSDSLEDVEPPLRQAAHQLTRLRRLNRIEMGADSREAFMGDIAKFAESTVGELDSKLKDVRIPRANLGPCPVCGHDIVENRKGYSCWSREDPGCGFVIWKAKAGKQLPLAVARELIKTGRTEKPVTGFRGRSGKSFRARLALQQNDEGRWRVEFDEPWAKAGAKPPEAEGEPAAPSLSEQAAA